jgi:predicted nucleic acid-binding protein
MILRLYLDICYFNRPYDDKSQLTVYLESEAKLFFQNGILERRYELAWSYMMDYENSLNPYEERKNVILDWRKLAVVDIEASEDIIESANIIMSKNIKKKDALHIACAIKAKADCFLTTDKRILNKYFNNIKIVNPLDLIRMLEG